MDGSDFNPSKNSSGVLQVWGNSILLAALNSQNEKRKTQLKIQWAKWPYSSTECTSTWWTVRTNFSSSEWTRFLGISKARHAPNHLNPEGPKSHFCDARNSPFPHFLFLWAFNLQNRGKKKKTNVHKDHNYKDLFQRLWRGSEAFGTLLLLEKNASVDSLKRSRCLDSCPSCCEVLFVPTAVFCFPHHANNTRINTTSFFSCIFSV